jgi:tRNA pseudouridine55 synthase
MFGLLNLDKPAGVTSRDVVNRVQRLVRPHKVGHAGTLDPLATGVLVVALGPATRLVEYVQRMPKIYQAKFLLGRKSETEDVEGQVEELKSPPQPSFAEIAAVLPRFIGTIEQRPPSYSALKVGGQAAYKLARRGEAVQLAARPVEIHAIDVLHYAYPELDLRVRCGSGTYVRSLGRDVAEALGTGAVMAALRRLAIGGFCVDEAVSLDRLSPEVIHERLLPPTMALGQMPQVVIDEQEATRLSRGQSIMNRWQVRGAEIAATDSAGRLAAILKASAAMHLQPEKYFGANHG